MATNIWFWIGFIAFVLVMLALDLGVFHRKAHVVTPKEAGIWVGVWVALALAFAGLLYVAEGAHTALTFVTGYLVEESLSVDNIFVIVLIFAYFAVPAKFQHRVLFWGIIGALIMRGIFIGVGAFLLQRFHWVIFLFGGLLVFTGIRMAFGSGEKIDPEHNPVVRLARRFLPFSNRYHGQSFFAVEQGRLVATPLLLTLLMVEFTDLVFAIDSIPAVFAVTQDAFIVFTSNIFAILGLRSLFFLLAHVVEKFHLLKYGLAVILTFIGAKMLLSDVVKVPIGLSLGVVLGVLVLSVAGSLLFPPAKEKEEAVGPR